MSSFLDDIGSAIGSGVDWLFGSDTGKLVLNLGGTALAGYALSQLTESMNKDSDTKNKEQAVDPGVRIQMGPNPYNKVPVIYGTAVIGGTITDVYMADDKLTMYFCFVLSEITGKLDCGRGAQSQIAFQDIYWNNYQVIFNADGYTVAGFKDETGKLDANPAGLIEFYTYSGNSETPVSACVAATKSSGKKAYEIFPRWTATDQMNGLVFAIAKVKYDKSKNVTSIGSIKYKLKNTLTEPGDVLFDYMTNTLYGAAIPAERINI